MSILNIIEQAGLQLYDSQKELITIIEDNTTTVCTHARRAGYTTAILWYLIIFAMTTPKNNIILFGHDKNHCMGMFFTMVDYLKITRLYDDNVDYHAVTQRKIQFDNGSAIYVMNGTQSDCVRGYSIDIAAFDMFTRLTETEADDILQNTLPALSFSKTRKLIIGSIAEPHNLFKQFWDSEQAGLATYKMSIINTKLTTYEPKQLKIWYNG